MVKHIFVVKDELVGFTSSLILEDNVDSAIRQFKHSIKTLLISDDFAPVGDINLYELGIFNTRTASIESHEPKLVYMGYRVKDELESEMNKDVVQN